jgi:hypothetical protein
MQVMDQKAYDEKKEKTLTMREGSTDDRAERLKQKQRNRRSDRK